VQRRVGLLLAVAAGLSLVLAACGGGEKRPIRIALYTPCHGVWGAGYEANIAAVELPLIERGARLAGKKPSDGLVGAEAAGRKVELLVGCSAEGGDAFGSPQELLEVRRLVESERADVVLGLNGPMSIAVGRYAKRYPDVAFVSAYAGYQSTTLRGSTPNFIALFPDYTMGSGGLGAYAYNRLGWRKAITIDGDTNLGWATTAGFVAAFCALGGDVVGRIWLPAANGAAEPEAILARVQRHGIDGIYWGAGDIFVLLELGRRLPLLQGDLGEKLVGHWYNSVVVPELLQAFGGRLDGFADEPGTIGLDPSEPAFARYAQRYTKTFPGQPAFFGVYGGQYYYTSMEAVLRALERAGGDPSGGSGGRFMTALARTEIDAPNGHLRLDERRQAIGPAYVVRGAWDEKMQGLVGRETLTYPDVDQTFGGYFTPSSPPPSRTSPPCKKLADPHAWMRVGG
jgi:branched-chain amino acid transport system substrate-binding protein